MFGVIATPYYSGWRGRGLYWARPSETTSALLTVVARDGLEKASKRLTERPMWNIIDETQGKSVGMYLIPGRFIPVEGYGVCYAEEKGEDEWVTHKDDPEGWSHVFLLGSDGIVTYKNNQGEWVEESTIPYLKET